MSIKIKCNDGEVFTLGGMEFIKFPDVDGMTPVVARDILFNSKFGDTNDLRNSAVLRRMEAEVLPKVIAAVGEENVCAFETDLTTLDGLKNYGVMKSKISLVTLDFYRANEDIFHKHKVSNWWWLATPESAHPHSNPYWILFVAPSGFVGGDGYDYRDHGVRPFCILKSDIFESSEV